MMTGISDSDSSIVLYAHVVSDDTAYDYDKDEWKPSRTDCAVR